METKAHTVKRFDAELEELNNNVVKMASAVEEQLGRLGDALVNLNADEAAKVMAEDHVINSWEAELDDYLETIISRRQPQAVELLFFHSVQIRLRSIIRKVSYSATTA